jgi:hypothetical protein
LLGCKFDALDFDLKTNFNELSVNFMPVWVWQGRRKTRAILSFWSRICAVFGWKWRIRNNLQFFLLKMVSLQSRQTKKSFLFWFATHISLQIHLVGLTEDMGCKIK